MKKRLLPFAAAALSLAHAANAQDELRVDHNTRQPTSAVNLSGANVSGLGAAAALNVGTTAGTVATGNDSRFSNTVTPEMYAASGVPVGVSQLEFTDAAINAGSTTLTSATAGFVPSDAAVASQRHVVIRGAGPAVAATTAAGTLTFTGQPAAGDTFSIGATVYTAVSALNGTANQVLIGANTAATMANLVAAINGAAGAGSTYGTGTAANTSATAMAGAGSTIMLTATTSGPGANGTLTITNSAAASFGAVAGIPITSLAGGYPAYTANLDAVVAGYTSPTQVTLNVAAGTSVSGAVLDASYNDSAALQAAATALANQGGGRLLLNPAKWYGLVSGGLLIPYGVEVTNGTSAKEPTQTNATGSPIENEALGGGIVLLGGAGGGDQTPAYVDFSGPRSALDSMVFFDPDESPNLWVPVAKPFAVRQSAAGTTVSGIELRNTYRGVDVQGGERTMTEYITGNPLLTGVRWDSGYDAPSGHDMHFADTFVRGTNLAGWSAQNSVGFLVWDNDEIYLDHLFTYSYRVGTAFQASTESGRSFHGSYGTMTNSGFDGAQFPVLFSCTQSASSQGMMLTGVGLTTGNYTYNQFSTHNFWALPGATGLINLNQCPSWGGANDSAIHISGGTVRYRNSDIGEGTYYNVLIDGPAEVDLEDLVYSGNPPGTGISEMVTSAGSATEGRMVRNRFFGNTQVAQTISNAAANLQTSVTDANFFAQAYSNPAYTWTALGNGANLKNWNVFNDTSGNWTLASLNDAFTSGTADIVVNHTTGLATFPAGAQAPQFTAQAGGTPAVQWSATGNGANLKNWDALVDSSGNFVLTALNDPLTASFPFVVINHTTGVVSLLNGAAITTSELLSGAGTYGGASGSGIRTSIGYNAPGNKQWWLTDPDYATSSTNGAFRVIFENGTVSFDGVNGTNTAAEPISTDSPFTFGVLAALMPRTFSARASSPASGTIQMFSDSTTQTWGATISGGGSLPALGLYDGANWTVIGK